MSHFTVIVLMPKSVENVKEEVGIMLEPYNEEKQVPFHEIVCFCVGAKARRASYEAVDKEFGDTSKLRKLYNEQYPEFKHQFSKDATEKEIEFWQNHWEEFIQLDKRNKFQDEFIKIHPLFECPDPECEDCHGTGKYFTHSNPDSQWDWYQIGGRWGGDFIKYNPEEHEENFILCQICNGTGLRNDELGKEARENDPSYTCNGCQGTGKQLKWNNEWNIPEEGNIMDLEGLIAQEYIPFALVLPDGNWVERGSMGWWAIVTNEQKRDDWKENVLNLYKECAKQGEYKGVLVDCHV